MLSIPLLTLLQWITGKELLLSEWKNQRALNNYHHPFMFASVPACLYSIAVQYIDNGQNDEQDPGFHKICPYIGIVLETDHLLRLPVKELISEGIGHWYAPSLCIRGISDHLRFSRPSKRD